jgi:cystathionine beta-lyase
MAKSPSKPELKPETRVVRAGQNKARNAGIVNTPVFHASTVLFDTVADMDAAGARVHKKGEKALYYGRRGTPTHWTLQEAMTELEGAADTLLAPSGLAACTIAILGTVKAGDHILVTDSVYEPTRSFCEGVLANFGVTTTYYPPEIGAGIGAFIKPNTSLIFAESPGSHTFEVQDLPALADAAHRHGAMLAVDNTWASPVFCQPLKLGADISIQAATKYIVGHSDAMVGTIAMNAAALPGIARFHGQSGMAVAPDEIYLATRGLRTLAVRLKRHQENARIVAEWLQKRAEVKRVLYPVLPDDPGHELWKRDFTGASGLLGVVFHHTSDKAVNALIDDMDLFGLGFSWGGFESLIAPSHPAKGRRAQPWSEPEPGVRLHIGLEDPDDLIADLDAGFTRFNKALG